MESKHSVLCKLLEGMAVPPALDVDAFTLMVALGVINAPVSGPPLSEADEEVLRGNAACLDATEPAVQFALRAARYLVQLADVRVVTLLMPVPAFLGYARAPIQSMSNGYNPTALVHCITQTMHFPPYAYPVHLQHIAVRLDAIAAKQGDERVAVGLRERFKNMVCTLNAFEGDFMTPFDVKCVIHMCLGPHAGKFFKGSPLLPRPITSVEFLQTELASSLEDAADKVHAMKQFLKRVRSEPCYADRDVKAYFKEVNAERKRLRRA